MPDLRETFTALVRLRVCRLVLPLGITLIKNNQFSQSTGVKIMAVSPQEAEDKMLKILNAWKTLAPTKTFGGKTVAEFEAQVNKSLAPRTRLDAIEDEKKEQLALRDDEDGVTMKVIQFVVNGVLADPEYGDNSALYEAMGYVRKSDRKSGLTRKKSEPEKK